HSNQDIIMNGATMDNGIMSNRHIISYIGGRFLIGGMYDSTILNIDLVSDLNIMHISSYDCIEPNTTLFSNGDLAYDGCVFCDIAIICYLRMFSFYCFYNGHKNSY